MEPKRFHVVPDHQLTRRIAQRINWAASPALNVGFCPGGFSGMFSFFIQALILIWLSEIFTVALVKPI